MTDLVDHTLKQWRQSVFQYGQTDCLLSVGDYMRACGGPDCCAQFRGTYHDAQGAQAIVEANGGPQRLLCLFGMAETDTDDPKRGDVVLFDTGTHDVMIAGICTGSGIAARLERGVIEIDKRFVQIKHCWEVI